MCLPERSLSTVDESLVLCSSFIFSLWLSLISSVFFSSTCPSSLCILSSAVPCLSCACHNQNQHQPWSNPHVQNINLKYCITQKTKFILFTEKCILQFSILQKNVSIILLFSKSTVMFLFSQQNTSYVQSTPN